MATGEEKVCFVFLLLFFSLPTSCMEGVFKSPMSEFSEGDMMILLIDFEYARSPLFLSCRVCSLDLHFTD